MDLIVSILKRFYPENCVETLVVDLDILNLECLKIVASKTVGYAIIVASVLVKVISFLHDRHLGQDTYPMSLRPGGLRSHFHVFSYQPTTCISSSTAFFKIICHFHFFSCLNCSKWLARSPEKASVCPPCY